MVNSMISISFVPVSNKIPSLLFSMTHSPTFRLFYSYRLKNELRLSVAADTALSGGRVKEQGSGHRAAYILL